VIAERILLANPFKTRIIAEAQIKTDKVDARILADLLRGNRVGTHELSKYKVHAGLSLLQNFADIRRPCVRKLG